MRLLLLLAVFILPLHARIGDSPEQVAARYGQPVDSDPAGPGKLTSRLAYSISGLIIVCGYLEGKVVMETITNPGRDFLPAEVEALLRTESPHLEWKPYGPYAGNMSYKRADGATATLTGNKLEIVTPAWTAALAKDEAASTSSARTNSAPAGALPKSAADSARSSP